MADIPVLEQVIELARTRETRIFLVGGAVRDRLLARPRYDIDLGVGEGASSLARVFANQVGGAFYVMDAEHDVARVICDQNRARYVIDFARLRGDSIEYDLATRDFTINAMALDLDTSQLIDPFHGRADLVARRLHAVADGIFQNDPIRLLRAVRFEAQLGFAIDA